jgi:hypothetical protein
MFWSGWASCHNFAADSDSPTEESLSWTMAWAVVKVEGQMTYTICVFGEPQTDVLLGRMTLQSLGLEVDLANQRLVPVDLPLVSFGIA